MIPLVLRFVFALLFIVSGTQKLLGHYQNFLYVVQGYDIFPILVEDIIARVFPWIETFIGLFILLGLYLKSALKLFRVCVVLFVLIISQALLRGIALEDCGCFGSLVSIPPYVTLIMDAVLVCLSSWTLVRIEQAGRFSLDHFFSSHS